MRWRVTYAYHPAAVCGFWKLLYWPLYIIAKGGTVSLNAPWSLVTSHPECSAGVSSTSYNIDTNFFYLNVYM